jgi:putative Ca2+/H+ antiporter (TMEM165/GDT1 family)
VQIGLFLTVFGVLFVAELPDKTMIATVVMGSRSRPVSVWAGAGAAFVLQVLISVVAGQFISLLPHRLVDGFVAALFLGGAAYLLFVPEKTEVEKGSSDGELETPGSFFKVAGTAFLVIFVGEFGDLTQILTANFAASSHQPLTVFLAGSLALLSVSAFAAFGGKALLRVLPLQRIRLGGGILLAGFGIYSVVKVITG